MKNKLFFLLFFIMYPFILSSQTINGYIKDDKGLPVVNVVVTDGFNFTTTDNDGKYKLSSDFKRSHFVYISTPSDFKIGIKEGFANSYFQRLDQAKTEYDFILERRNKKCSEFLFVPISDPQITRDSDLIRFKNETVLDLKDLTKTYSNLEIYGMSLGDIVGDRMDMFEPYKQSVSNLGLTMFSTIGNHDFDLRYPALNNKSDTTGGYAECQFERFFGPYNYSFNIGDVHFISLKNIDYYGGRKYKEKFGKEQLEWLKKDLSYVKPGTLLLISMHAALFNKSVISSNALDAKEFQKIVSKYNTHLFEGHTHYYENTIVSPNLYEHNIGAACGAWWQGNVNRCGAPNGYLVVSIKDNNIKWYYKAIGKSINDSQFRLYNRGDFKSEPNCIVANVWDWDPSYKIEYIEDGKKKGTLLQFNAVDQEFINMIDKITDKSNHSSYYKTNHLFKYKPSVGALKIKVIITNRFGDKFSKSINLK